MAGLLTRLGENREEVVQVRRAVTQDLVSDALIGRFGVKVGLAAALRRGPDLIGMQVAGYGDDRGEPFAPQQERLAWGMAQLASLALENARLLEELRHATRLKEDFLDAVSHELRTPLNIIMGYTELLSDEAFGGLTQEQLHALHGVDRNARRLLELVTGMLDISRFEEKPPVEIRPVRIAELVEELREETEEVAENPRLTLGLARRTGSARAVHRPGETEGRAQKSDRQRRQIYRGRDHHCRRTPPRRGDSPERQ